MSRLAPWSRTLQAALLLAAVTSLVYVPEFFRDPADAETTRGFLVAWLVVLLLAAPVTAYALNRRAAEAMDTVRCLLIAAPQPPLVVALTAFDVWLDVRSGYLLAGSGEEAMSYGIGLTLSTVFGLVLMTMVAVAARLGARRPTRGSTLGTASS